MAQALSVIMVGLVSGWVLKQQQLSAVTPELAAVYPFTARLPFILQRVVEVVFFFSLNATLISLVLRLSFARASARLGETYWLLAAAYLFGPVARFWLYPVLLLVINVRAVAGHRDRWRLRQWYLDHRLAIVCVAVILFVYGIYFTPLLDPLVGFDRVDRFTAIIPYSLANTMRSTLPAIAGLQEPAWHPQLALGGGSLRPEILGHQNYLLSAFFSFFPFSSADLEAIFQLEKLAVFCIYCLGGVGYYLFVRYGLRLRHGTALVVGIVFVMSDGVLARHPEVDWGYASCSVPWILLAVTTANRMNSLWLFAVAGGVTGVSQGLHFTHPEVTLAILYFVSGFIAWDYALSSPVASTWATRGKRLAAIPVFAISSAVANYRFIGNMLEYSYDGNHVTSERLHGYGYDDVAVVVQNLLAPLGLQNPPFTDIGTPYFYGLTVGFLAIFGLVRLVRRSSGSPMGRSWQSYAVVAPVALGLLGLFNLSAVGALYWLGFPGVPFHTGLRILHPVNACLMVLFAFGLEELLFAGNEEKTPHARGLMLRAFFAYLAVAWFYGKDVLLTPAQKLQVLLAVITVFVASYLPVPRRVRLGIVGTLVVATALFTTRQTTMVTGVGYHKLVLEHSRVNRKTASNTIISRLAHPENYTPKTYPFSLTAKLRAARVDLSNPRTQLYVWNLLRRFRRDLELAVDFARRGGESSPAPDVAGSAMATIDGLLGEIRSYSHVGPQHLDAILKLAPAYDQLYYREQAGGLREVDRIMSSIPASSVYPRVAFSNAYKTSAGGDTLNDFPTFENSHYYVVGAANLRWSSALDYFFPDISPIMSEPTWYDANMFPPVSRTYLDLLGFDYLVATDAELPAFQTDTEVVAKLPTGTLLRNKTALPRASLFRKAKVIDPINYNELTFDSMSRVKQGRALLDGIDARHELLIEADTPFSFANQEGAPAQNSGEGVDIVRISGNFAVFKVHNPGPEALLSYTDAYHPDWRAYVDKGRERVLRSDLGFKAVTVPTGEHLVWMEFSPTRSELLQGLVYLIGAYALMQVARRVDLRRNAATTEGVSS